MSNCPSNSGGACRQIRVGAVPINSNPATKPFAAECQLFDCHGKNVGYISFVERLDIWKTEIDITVWGQCPGLHGIHIHNSGEVNDFRQHSSDKCCDILGGHWNPYDAPHGDMSDDWTRCHAGDLGNIKVYYNGRGNKVVYSRLIRLRGRFNVIGRSVVLHANPDDLGRGGNAESLKTGNSGARIACGVIRRIS